MNTLFCKTTNPYDPLWTTDPPNQVFESDRKVVPSSRPTGDREDRPSLPPKSNPRKHDMDKEVVVKHPLFELKVDAVGRTPFEAMFKSIPGVDFPKLMHTGKTKAICFNSAFLAPHNTCNYDRCVQSAGRGNKTKKP
jgi:hypothetical protein